MTARQGPAGQAPAHPARAARRRIQPEGERNAPALPGPRRMSDASHRSWPRVLTCPCAAS
ncbi:hypothetical protein ADP8_03981 [Roseomonas mucosa]|nr:hypothetical protein ADP8_03981 [Roseomonas mucosa]